MNRFVTAPLMQLWDKALNVGKLSPQIYFICIKYYIWHSVYPRGKIIILWYSYPWTSISNITKNRMLYKYYICFKNSFVNKNKVLFSVPKSCRNEHYRNMSILHSKLKLSRTRRFSRLSDWVIDTPVSYWGYLNFDPLLRSHVSFLQFFLGVLNLSRPVELVGLEQLLRYHAIKPTVKKMRKGQNIQDDARNVIPLIVHITHFYYYKNIWHLIQN